MKYGPTRKRQHGKQQSLCGVKRLPSFLQEGCCYLLYRYLYHRHSGCNATGHIIVGEEHNLIKIGITIEIGFGTFARRTESLVTNDSE